MGKSGGFICGVFVGAIVGSAVGFLCAPESGEETRQKLKEGVEDKLRDFTDNFDVYGEDAKKYFDNISNNLTGKIRDYKDQIEARIQNIQNEVNEDIAELNEELEQLHNEEENQRQNIVTLADENDD